MCPRFRRLPCPSRSQVPEPQSAEQLVEVPTVLSPTRIAVQIAEQIVGIAVPQGRGGKRLSQGFLTEQSSTAISSSLERIYEPTVEQIVDIPSSGDGLGQGSSSPAGPADEDFTGVFFALFPVGKKCAVGFALESEGARQCQLIHAGGSARVGLVVGVTHSRSAGRVGGGQGGSEEGALEQEEAEEEEEKKDEAVTFLIGCLVLPEEYFQCSAWFDSGYLYIRPSTVVFFSSPCI